MSIQNPNADRGVALTKRGLIAILCAQAEPFTVPACWCGEHVHRDGLCRAHARPA